MADEPEVDKPDAQKPADTPELGDAGKKALDEERRARRDAERQLHETRERLSELETAEVRRDVAAEKGLSAAQAKHLTGASREELEAHADELLEAFKPSGTAMPSRRPVADLKGGMDPTQTPEAGPSVMADRILSKGI